MGWVKISPESTKDMVAYRKPLAMIAAGQPGFVPTCPTGALQGSRKT